jgi:hypothetical protein
LRIMIDSKKRRLLFCPGVNSKHAIC